MKFRRRRSFVLIAVLAALLLSIAVFAYVQRNNLRAFLMSVQHSEEELAAMQEQSLADLMEKYGLEPIPQITTETPVTTENPSDSSDTPPEDVPPSPSPSVPTELPKLTPGLIPEAIKPSAINQGQPEKPTQKPQQAQQPQLPQQPQQAKQDRTEVLPKDVQNLVYSLYTLQSQYVGQLDGIAASTRSRFDALPAEQRTNATRASMVKATLSQAIALESQCNGRVASILRELRATLKKHGLNDSVADNAENYYATQKGLIKAEYMRKYNKYLK